MSSPTAFYQRTHGLYPVSQQVVEDAIAHAVAASPEESVGIVIDGQYRRLRNVHPHPYENFLVNDAEYLPMLEGDRYEVQAVIHSHPEGLVGPTAPDMRAQLEWQVPFGIVSLKNRRVQDVVFFGDQVAIAPVIGRPFISGVYDCYSTVRDRLRTKYNVSPINLPRNHMWWELVGEDNDLFMQNYERLGFVEIDFMEMRPGDTFIGSVGVHHRVNHCGIYEGDGLVLHHIFGTSQKPRFSTMEAIYPWKRYITKCLRHLELQVPANAPSSSQT